ncbi:hypothetical protein [Thiomicrorhabdus indica]|uniref:hypothetical protein n=1 Tax=Thiomicrorhabdus indica TaxID=2267253 RepID=UPI00102D7E5A|nr:hypothetical protein [Thiomicrorhabdus indica]
MSTITALDNAIATLIEKDIYLMEVNANERSISAKLAFHLQAELPEYEVDVEYNRDGIEPKRLAHMELYPDQEDEDAKTVFPDIIAHKRSTNNNFLVIEIKKESSSVDRNIDRRKLRGYMRELEYQYAYFIEFGVYSNAGKVTIEQITA